MHPKTPITQNLPDSRPEGGRITLPAAVLLAEHEHRRKRRTAAGIKPDAPVVGLALSGGGIRSATFCFGILQQLARKNVLRAFDYLSTVSGGGYIGSCLSAFLSRGGIHGHAPSGVRRRWSFGSRARTDGKLAETRLPYVWVPDPAGEAGPAYGVGTGPDEPAMPLLEPGEVHHLRTRGEFLILRRGVVNRELLRFFGSTLSGFVVTVSLFLGLLLCLAGVYVLYVSLIAGAEPWAPLGANGGSWSTNLDRFLPEGSEMAMVALGGLLGLTFAVVAAFSVFRKAIPKLAPRTAETGEDRGEAFILRIFWVLLILFTLAFLWMMLSRWASRGTWALGIPLALHLASLLTLIGLYLVFGGFRWDPRARSVFNGMQGVSLYATLVSLMICLFLPLLWWADGLENLAVSVGALITARFLAGTGGAAEPASQARKIGPMLRKLALNIAVPLFVVAGLLAATLGGFKVLGTEDPVRTGLILLVFGAGVATVIGWTVNFNKISPHVFYMDRLSEAYLRTEVRVSGGMAVQRDDSELELRDLHGRAPEAPEENSRQTLQDKVHEVLQLDRDIRRAEKRSRKEGTAATQNLADLEAKAKRLRKEIQRLHLESAGLVENPAPYHLVVCALNLAGSRDLARKDRKSDHFIFSRLYCGSTTTGYVPTAAFRAGRTTLSQAMTLSAAAAASAMGVYTSAAQAFITTLFNLRLGHWLVNPRMYRGEGVYPDGKKPNERDCPRPRSRSFLDSRAFWPIYLLREILRRTTASRRLVNVSDGGHTGDNMGIYPLLQRRCDLIVACDGGRDPDATFQDLASAIRMIFVDENVKVDMDLDSLRPDPETGRASAHFAIGRIEYPSSAPQRSATKGESDSDAKGDADGDPDLPEFQPKTGWILYLKTSLVGDEPISVKSYASVSPEFPHQTTMDQFFDDAQFEAYRALGQTTAGSLLEEIGPNAEAWQAWCEKQWKSPETGAGGPAVSVAGAT